MLLSDFFIIIICMSNKQAKDSFNYMMDKTEARDSYAHVLKYTGIFGGVQGLSILVGLVRNKLVALLLGPGGMGLVSLFNSAISFISQATNLGISFSAVRHISEIFDSGDEARVSHYIKVVRAWSLVTALFGMFVCVVAGPFLSDYTFSWGDHTIHFLLLSPVVGMLAITGGETAILKGARRLKALALIQIYSVFAALVISVPVYYSWGQKGIVPVIVITAFASMLLTVSYSYRYYPLRINGSNGVLGEGMEMVRLGVAFVLSGIMGSGAEVVIRSFLNVSADLDTVGLYNAGYMITVTYAGMVFTAMETDYFPRLSAVNHDVQAVNLAANRQIEVSLLIISPMLAFLIISLPVLIPLLYSHSFVPVVSMAQVAVFSMYLKSMSLPVAYITLAKGDSLAFFALEAVYDVLLVILIVFGFRMWGLFGTGVALSLSYLLDLVMILVYAYVRYRYVVSPQVRKYVFIQFPLGIAAYSVTLISHSWLYWLSGVGVVALSTAVSVYILHKKTSLWNKLKQKMWRHG